MFDFMPNLLVPDEDKKFFRDYDNAVELLTKLRAEKIAAVILSNRDNVWSVSLEYSSGKSILLDQFQNRNDAFRLYWQIDDWKIFIGNYLY